MVLYGFGEESQSSFYRVLYNVYNFSVSACVQLTLFYIRLQLLVTFIHNAVCHAELNVIISALRHQAEVKSTILYTTSPLCLECAKIIVQSGVGTVIYYSPMKRAGTMSDDENSMCSAAVEEIMYRAKIPYR